MKKAFILLTAGLILIGFTACSPTVIPALSPTDSPQNTTATVSPAPSNAALNEPPTPAIIGADQQAIVDEITATLKQQRVPIKSAQVISFNKISPPLVVDFVILDSGADNEAKGALSIGSNLIYSAVTLARKRGLVAGGVGITYVDAGNNVLAKQINRLKSPEELTPEFDPPFKLTYSEVMDLFMPKISLFGLTFKGLEVSPAPDGLRTVTVSLESPDIQTANNGISKFIGDSRAQIYELNRSSGAQIARYRVTLRSSAGELLFNFIYDLQLGSQNSWHTEGLANVALK
jgi:hypothetical protein